MTGTLGRGDRGRTRVMLAVTGSGDFDGRPLGGFLGLPFAIVALARLLLTRAGGFVALMRSARPGRLLCPRSEVTDHG